MRLMHLKSEIAQRELSNLGRSEHVNMPHTKAKNLVLSYPFFNRSRAGRRQNLPISLRLYAQRRGWVLYPRWLTVLNQHQAYLKVLVLLIFERLALRLRICLSSP
jgi:hypothetical protein